jgi:hypothetical protein
MLSGTTPRTTKWQHTHGHSGTIIPVHRGCTDDLGVVRTRYTPVPKKMGELHM